MRATEAASAGSCSVAARLPAAAAAAAVAGCISWSHTTWRSAGCCPSCPSQPIRRSAAECSWAGLGAPAGAGLPSGLRQPAGQGQRAKHGTGRLGLQYRHVQSTSMQRRGGPRLRHFHAFRQHAWGPTHLPVPAAAWPGSTPLRRSPPPRRRRAGRARGRRRGPRRQACGTSAPICRRHISMPHQRATSGLRPCICIARRCPAAPDSTPQHAALAPCLCWRQQPSVRQLLMSPQSQQPPASAEARGAGGGSKAVSRGFCTPRAASLPSPSLPTLAFTKHTHTHTSPATRLRCTSQSRAPRAQRPAGVVVCGGGGDGRGRVSRHHRQVG